MLRLLSLFDYSGQWSEPFRANGWDVICWDIKSSELEDINLIDSAGTALEMFEDVNGILAAPPCTDFTKSGAQYWKQKDADGQTAASIELVRQVMRLADLFRPTDDEYDRPFFWVVENPVGRMGKVTGIDHLTGGPHYFDPWQYAGWLNPSSQVLAELDRIRAKNGYNVTAEENDLVVSLNAYTKKTGLWGEFRMPRKKPVPPVKTSPQGSFTQRLGGKSEKTKEARSNTPMGFAWAFYEANKDFQALKENEMFIQ